MRKMLFTVVALACAGAFADATSLDYVQTGLVGHWDAIDNQGFAAHDDAATTWVDIVAGRTFALTGTTFDGNSLSFAGTKESYGELSADDTAHTFSRAFNGTVEIVFASASTTGYAVFQSAAATGPSLLRNGDNFIVGNKSSGYLDKSCFDMTGGMNTLALCYTSGAIAVNKSGYAFVNGAAKKTKANAGANTGYGTGTIIGNRNSKASPFNGKIYAIRVYSRRLSADEIAANAALDQQRFANGQYTPLTKTLRVTGLPDAYGPAENYGYRQLEPGDTAQLSVPETYADPDSGTTYRCTGWGLKNAAGATVAMGTGNVCDYAHPDPAEGRRLVWLWTADAWPTGAGVRYVSLDGDDAATGADWLHAYRTVQTAIDNAGEGGSVLLAAGEHYSTNVVELTNDVSLVGCARRTDSAVIMLRTMVAKGCVNVLKMTGGGSVVTNLTLTNGGDSTDTTKTYASGVSMSAGTLTHCVVTNCITSTTASNGGGIYMTGGTVRNCLIAGCDAYDTGGSGMTGSGIYMTAGLVENCRILNNGWSAYGSQNKGGGVYMTGGTLRGCLIAGNKRRKEASGVFAKDGAVVENCTIVGNTQARSESTATGVKIEGRKTVFRNNVVWGNTAFDGTTVKEWDSYNVVAENIYNNDCSETIIGTNISVDPNFADAAKGDYHLGFSDCVNGGANQDWMAGATDMDGNARIISDVVDIGCYERKASTGLECSFTVEQEKALDNVKVALAATVVGDTAGLVYYWTFVRADGLVQAVSGSEYGNFTNTLAAGVWDIRLDVTNGVGKAAGTLTEGAADVRASAAYVGKNGTATYPYATPEAATPGVEDAFALLGDGGTLYVDEGEYVIAEPLQLVAGNGSRIVAPKGPDKTAIRVGDVAKFTSQAYRGVTLAKASAYVEGVTFAGGYRGLHYDGAEYGIYGVASMTAAGATITNCVFRDVMEATHGLTGMGVSMSAGLLAYCRFENVSARGSGGTSISGGTVRMTGGTADRIVIDRCFTPNANISVVGYGDVLYAEGKGTLVKNALVTHCTTHKSTPLCVKDAALVNCTVACNTNAAAASGTAGGKTFYNDLTAGVLALGTGTVKNCIFADNWSTAAGCVTNFSGAATYTLANDRDASFVTEENHNRIGDPGFRNAAAGDFRLTATSQAVNAGDWTALGATVEEVKAQFDLTGASRLNGPDVDMGCYEQKDRGLIMFIR